MIKMNSYVYCVDNTGVAFAKAFQIFGNKDKRVATYGDKVFIVVKSLDRSSGNLLDEKQRKKFKKGTIHRAVVVHTKKKVMRKDST
jgi:large subunit ribosomal protein L14